MTGDDKVFVRDFYRAVSVRVDQPLRPDDPRYVPIYQDPQLAAADPVELLARAVEWTPGETVQLLSGFRGTGKTTELLRLQQRLRGAGYVVLHCDLEDYLNLSIPIDVSDFLIAVAGALGDALAAASPQEAGAGAESGYWDRLAGFLSRFRLTELSATLALGPASVGVKGALKEDPSFRERLQKHMAGLLGALVSDVRAYVEECVKELRRRRAAPVEILLTVDSIEHIRGTYVNAAAVQSSVETLFASHADKLHLPYLHVVYTVPPYLKVRYQNLGSLYAPGGVKVVPAVKVRSEDGSVFSPGVAAMTQVIARRGDWQRLLGSPGPLEQLILLSGGHMQDLLKLVGEVLLRAGSLPVDKRIVNDAISQVRSEFLPIADADAVWLARIHETHRASLEDNSRLPDLARFFDTHLVLCYRNDAEWYDVHPLVLDEILVQAQEAAGRGAERRPD